jgi:hypothetical protein
MKFFFQLFAKLLDGSLGILLIGANFIICLLAFDWSGFFSYLNAPARINCHLKPVSLIDFSICGYSGSTIDAAVSLIQLLYAALTLPSILMTEYTLAVIKDFYPLWCYQTHELLFVPVFAVFNTFYWLFLGDLIEKAHSAYLLNKPSHQILSVFPKTD